MAALVTSSADARGLKTGFLDDIFTSPQASIRDKWLDEAHGAGSDIIRINAFWGDVAASKPASPTNPADPAYDFSGLDAAVKDASARGFTVMLTVLDAPSW